MYQFVLTVLSSCFLFVQTNSEVPVETEKIWSAFNLSGEQVRTGEYKASLQMFSVADPEKAVAEPFRVHGWFDRNAGNERLDYQHKDDPICHYIQLPDSNLLMNGNASSVSRQLGKLDFSQFSVRPFDIWCAPLSGAVGIFDGAKLELAQKYLQSGVGKSVQDGQAVKMTIEFPNFPTTAYITFDSENGMTPIEFKEMFRLEPGKPPLPPANQANSIWKKTEGDVFVPVSIDATTTSGKVYRRAIVDVEWISVNKPIDPIVFTIEGLSLPKMTQVVDYTLGPPIIESIVGGVVPEKLKGKYVNSLLIRTPSHSRERLVYTVLFFLVIAIFFLFKKIRPFGSGKRIGE